MFKRRRHLSPVISSPVFASKYNNLNSNLVAYWKLEESAGTAVDSTGRGNDLAASGNPVGAVGKIGNSRLFIRANPSILNKDTNGNDDLSLGDTDWTIVQWFYLVSTASPQLLVTKHLNPSSGEFAFMIASMNAYFLCYGDSNGEAGTIVIPTTLLINTWYFLAGRHSATTNTMTATLNATHYTINTLLPVAKTSNKFRMGAQESASFNLDGRLDEVGVWKRYLSDADLSLLY